MVAKIGYLQKYSIPIKLDRFIAELVKRAIKWPKYLSNTAACTVLDMDSARSYILKRKLGFLVRLMNRNARGTGVEVLRSMMDDIESVCLVKECRELEEWFNIDAVDKILDDTEDKVSLKELGDYVRHLDRKKRTTKCAEKAPLIAKLANECGWLKLWDGAMERGWKHTRGLSLA